MPAWDSCGRRGCQGAQLPGLSRCVLHAVDDGHLSGPLTALDARGVVFKAGDLARVLDQVHTEPDGMRRLTSLDLEEARFEELAKFGPITVAGPANLSRAVFEHGASFFDSVFEEGAECRSLRMEGWLGCVKTRFEKPLSLVDATITTLELNKATVAGLALTDTEVRGRMTVDSTHITGELKVHRARFSSSVSFLDSFVEGSAWLLDAEFVEAATWMEATFGRNVMIDRCKFRDFAGFNGASFGASVSIREVQFDRELSFDGVVAFGAVSFEQSRFAAARSFGRLVARSVCLDGTIFDEHVEMQLSTDQTSCQDAIFGGGATLGAKGDLSLAGAVFGAASVVSPMVHAETDELAELRLLSLERADVDRLLVSNVDLGLCRFAGAHNLDRLRIEGQGGFADAPSWFNARRRTIAEEHEWRLRHGAKSWALDGLKTAANPPEAEDVASIYRSLRKSREDAKDHPGAADFYYGEMEMRRRLRKQPRKGDAPASRAETGLVMAYWVFSGYGLRASRSLVALVALVLAAAVTMQAYGFDPELPFGKSLLFTFATAVSFGAAPDYRLTDVGDLMRVIVRILGPLLLGLGLLAIRGRVRR